MYHELLSHFNHNWNFIFLYHIFDIKQVYQMSWYLPIYVLFKYLHEIFEKKTFILNICWISFLAHLVKRLCELLLSPGIRRMSSIFIFKSFRLKPLHQIQAHLAGVFLGWFPSKLVSDNPFKTKNRNFFNCLC
jgi:hypothetical protein